MATKYDIIKGLTTLGMYDNFNSIEIIETHQEKEVLTTVEYELKKDLPPTVIKKSQEAIQKVATDHGVSVTSTKF